MTSLMKVRIRSDAVPGKRGKLGATRDHGAIHSATLSARVHLRESPAGLGVPPAYPAGRSLHPPAAGARRPPPPDTDRLPNRESAGHAAAERLQPVEVDLRWQVLRASVPAHLV